MLFLFILCYFNFLKSQNSGLLMNYRVVIYFTNIQRLLGFKTCERNRAGRSWDDVMEHKTGSVRFVNVISTLRHFIALEHRTTCATVHRVVLRGFVIVGEVQVSCCKSTLTAQMSDLKLHCTVFFF